jgi:ParB family chromosome partitioning protein
MPALIDLLRPDEHGAVTEVRRLAIDRISSNPGQPRRYFDEEALADLAASIREHGILQPVLVRPRADGHFQLVAGERRWRAARIAGLTEVPAIVEQIDDESALEIAIIENLQREDLSPLEEAEALAALIERHGYSHAEVAQLIGKSRPYVSNTLAITRLPEAVKNDLNREGRAVSRELLMGVARAEDPDAAVALWRRVQLDLLSVRRFREEKAGVRPERPAVQELMAAARRVNRALLRVLAEEVPVADAPRVARILRRTMRLAERELATVGASRAQGPA